MLLNLREIIYVPSKSVEFEYDPDLSDVSFGSVTGVLEGAHAKGHVRNSAGILCFSAELDVTLKCVCARCLREFELPVHKDISATLSETVAEEDEGDLYPLDGDNIDVNEIIVTELLLDIEQTILCSEDCKGICEKCGANLNDGPCDCRAEIDPRLSVLGQLLENE